MLIPQYTLRRLLAITTGVAVVFSIFAMALRGHVWAVAASAAIGAIVVLLLVQAALFGVVWLFSLITGSGKGQSPFMQPPRAAEDNAGFPGRVVILAAVGLFACAGNVLAQMPSMPGNSRTHAGTAAGLAIGIQADWPNGFGYQPVRVFVNPVTPTIADRTLTVEISHQGPWSSRSQSRVVQDIEIPAGSGQVQATIAVPLAGNSYQYKIEVSEDGRVLPRMSFWASMNQWGEWTESLPRMVLVADRFTLPPQDLDELSEMLARHPNPGPADPGPLAECIVPWPAAELPERWIDYSSLDMLWVSVDELRSLNRKRPAVFAAILRWTAAGGNLCIYGAGDDWQWLREIESILELGDPPAEDDDPLRGWVTPDKSVFGKFLTGIGNEAAADPVYEGAESPDTFVPTQPLTDADDRPTPTPVPTPPKQPPFLSRQFDLGVVAVFAADKPFPGDADIWQWFFNSLGSQRWLWTQRHGLSATRRNADFWDFLIPGVGLAPVTAFRVLISLFVLVIGPLNYLLLRRWKRLHLLLVTIPGGALLVTGLLFGYAVVADGLGTRVRVRSFTHIDQPSGRTVCWTRLSYYAGLAPAGGLVFPPDTVVLPLEADFSMRGGERAVFWEDQQRLVSGWLPARTPTQLVTIRARQANAGLAIRPSADGTQLLVRNGLGTDLKQLLVCADDGRCYWAEAVAPGSESAAAEVVLEKALAPLRSAIVNAQPRVPAEIDPQAVRRSGFGRYYYSGSTNLPDPAQRTGMLETSVAAVAKLAAGDLAPRSYVAIVGRSPEIELGLPKARVESEFHVIRGNW